MFYINKHNIQQFLDQNEIRTRPNAGDGLWLMFLLPLSLMISTFSHPLITTPTYKLSSIFSLGLMCSSLIFLFQVSQHKRLKIFNLWQMVLFFIIAALFRICLHRGLLFSVYSAMFSTMFYQKIYFNILKKMPFCFTLGEAKICSQSFTLLLYFTSLNVIDKILKPTSSVIQMSTLTIQIGLIGISTIAVLAYKYKNSIFTFYTVIALILVIVIILPLQIILRTNPLLWILDLFWYDLLQNKVILYWSFFSIIAVVAINQRVKQAKKATTGVRKIFHFLYVVVFVLGLLYNCSLLYLASGVVLGIFFMLEILRVLNIPPLAQSLHNGYVIFGDEKDVGIIALTPMYLLAGCALPLWIHPAPCDVTNSATFNLLPLLSGVLITGIGDTAASIVGSNFGKHHWSGSRKSIEGTLACITSQLLFIFILVYLDLVKLYMPVDYIKVAVGVTSASVIEAKTDQVDNLVLPFVMYIIFII